MPLLCLDSQGDQLPLNSGGLSISALHEMCAVCVGHVALVCRAGLVRKLNLVGELGMIKKGFEIYIFYYQIFYTNF